MADLTLKLIWYKLGETYSKMAETGASMKSWFSWEDHFLDVLLIFWISFGLLIVGVINSLSTFFGPLQPRISWDKPKDGGASTVAAAQGPHQPESTFWLNSALNWFYLHYNQFPEFVDAWVKSLNVQANKLGGPVQLRFEKVQSGSLPPKFGEVTYDAGPEDKYVLNARVDSRDLSFAVFASQQTHEGVKLTNLVITVLRLRGQLRIRCFRKGNDMMAEVGFLGRPNIKVQGKPVNPYMDPSDMVDIGVVEEVIRNTICLTSTTLNLSEWINRSGECDTIPICRTHSNELARSSENLQHPGSAPQSPRHAQQASPEVFEAKEIAQQQSSAFHVPTIQTPTKVHPQRPPQQKGPGDKRVLVKVIKASGLKQNDGSVDPYCIMYVDTPPQTEVTNTVRSTYNPFWDEQFYFDLNRDSQEIRFEVLDKSRRPNENFLGEAVVYCEDLARNPSSRQIIPLQGRLGVGEFVSGSVTVEFLYMDSSEASNVISPRRTIETSQSMTPGGTRVTTTMTTTQRPQNSRYDTTIDGSPSYIEKRTFDYNNSNPELETSELYRPSSTLESAADDDMSRLSAPNAMSSPESPEISYPPQVKDDIDLHRAKRHDETTPSLKKSRSLGGSLKKLFRRSRKRSKSQGRGEQSRESSVSRQSRHTSQDPSREGSLTRTSQHTSQHDTVIL